MKNLPKVNGQPVFRAAAQACIVESITATSNTPGTMDVVASCIQVSAVEFVGAEYSVRGANDWTRAVCYGAASPELSLSIEGLQGGETYDVRVWWYAGDCYFHSETAVQCTVVEEN